MNLVKFGVAVGAAYFVGSSVGDAVGMSIAEGSRNTNGSQALKYGAMAASGLLAFVVVGRVLK